VIGDAGQRVGEPGLEIKYPISALPRSTAFDDVRQLLNSALSHTHLRSLTALSPARDFAT
jgi:hypothetical protein